MHSVKKDYFIGLMSGTSIDAMDGCLADFTGGKCQTLATASLAFSPEEKRILNELCRCSNNELEKMQTAGIMLAEIQAKVVNDLLHKSSLPQEKIIAIGSHGQTVRHCPEQGFSVQLNSPSKLAYLTGIDVISDFRAADLSAGGEGAPLTPAFNAGFFHRDKQACLILNLGGIANLTAISEEGSLLCGFDTGPADTLLDLCARNDLARPYDLNAQCAKTGRVQEKLLNRWLAHPYFSQKPPKSTGRELFNEKFLKDELLLLHENKLSIEDLMASLTELTIRSAFDAIKMQCQIHPELFNSTLVLCGGGAKNPLIHQNIASRCQTLGIHCTDCASFGADPDFLEALSFAWFAYSFCNARPLRLNACTGASCDLIAGSLTPATTGAFARKNRG